MAWVKLDDQAPRNLKMLRAGPAACWLWVCGIAHCQSQLTDGFISMEALPMIGIKGVSLVRRLADSLVTVGLFERVEGGYRVHDYLVHNASRSVVLRKRAEDSARKKPQESSRIPSGIVTESNAPRADGRGMGWDGKERDSEKDHGASAAHFLERYQALYAEHRKGARLHIKPSLDWTRVCDLLQTWDVDRLEKLAVILLTTDDEWIAKTDRGIGVFVARASWCDDRLKAWEADHEVVV